MAASEGATKWWERDVTPGYLLLGATALSFLLQNSFLHDAFKAVLDAPVKLIVGPYALETYGKGLVKDALMAVFFLFVGLELKRECIEGPFRSLRTAAVPGLAALGGMAAPALIYLYLATGAVPGADPAYVRGWAIPSATDIAFAVGVLSLLGSKVPSGLRLFLLAVAIVDDLGAIIIIALFYTEGVDATALAVSGALFAAMVVMNRQGVRALTPYWVLGVFLWAAMAKTGISPTLAGVLTAIAVPMRRPDGRSPLIAAEHNLKPYVQLGVMPLFALAMAGVPLTGMTMQALWHPIAVGIAAGLLIGKPLGIALFTLAGARMLRQTAPGTPAQLIGMGMVAGIGFTMSLFIGALAFDDPALQLEVRIGVIGGSVLSATLGLMVLNATLKGAKGPRPSDELGAQEDLAEREGLLEKR